MLNTPPWTPWPQPSGAVVCNVCRWEGEEFTGPAHCELAHCPECGANARDRFLHWCLTERVPLHPALRIIECSPRLGDDYRSAMGTWFFYRTSDHDQRSHRGNLCLDLQDIDLPDDCLDVMLCAHVLEHVPDTDRALAELHRVIAPGGHLLLQVPVLQGVTAVPDQPEFHGDDTPVFWRFGFDLTERLRDHGFDTALCATRELADAITSSTGPARCDGSSPEDGADPAHLAEHANPWPVWSGEFDVPDLLEAARNSAVAEDLAVVADDQVATRLGLRPGYMFLTWDAAVDV